MTEKIIKIPVGLKEKWNHFPWEKFPAGVTVHFALTGAGGVYLLRRGYSYWVFEQTLRRGEALADTVARLHIQLALEGIRLQSSLTPEVSAVRQELTMVRVLVRIECVPVANRRKLESFKGDLVFDGVVGDHPMFKELNSLFGVTSKSLPPQVLAAA